MDSLIKRGRPVLFEPGQFLITGSKLFETLSEKFATQGVKVAASKTIKCDAEIRILNPENEVVHIIPSIQVEMKGGTEEVDVNLVLPNSPFFMRFERALRLRERPKEENMTISFDLAKWSGQPLLLLSYFEQIYRFTKLIEIGNKIRFSFYFQGNKLFEGITGINEKLFYIRELLPYLAILDNARFIAQKLNINPLVPKFETITQDDAYLFAAIRTLLETGEYKQSSEGLKTSAVMQIDDNILSMVRRGTFPEGTLRISQPAGSIDVFGHRVESLLLTHVFTNAKLTDESKEKLLHSYNGAEIEFEWVGLSGSEHIITRTAVTEGTPEL